MQTVRLISYHILVGFLLKPFIAIAKVSAEGQFDFQISALRACEVFNVSFNLF